MKVSIVSRTFDGDAEWLARALPTWVEKCNGYDGIYITGISNECKKVQGVAEKNGVEFIPHDESAQITTGYVNQQYTKMCADLLVDSDYILFVDADTICYEEHDPSVWFDGDLPILLHSEWSNVGDANCWFKPMVRALGWYPPYEFMRRLPLIYHASTIKNCREYIQGFHELPLWLYMANLTTFTEFNVLGAYAYENEADKYHFECPETSARRPNPFKQFWSHGGLDKQIEEYEHQ